MPGMLRVARPWPLQTARGNADPTLAAGKAIHIKSIKALSQLGLSPQHTCRLENMI